MQVKINLLVLLFLSASLCKAQPTLTHSKEGKSIIFTSSGGERLRLTPYGNYIIRVQAVRKDEDLFPDNRYEMVESHQWAGSLKLSGAKNSFLLTTGESDGISMRLDNAMRLSFYGNGPSPFLKQDKKISWDADTIHTSFVFDNNEHFTGLGHGYYGREESIDLKGKIITRNYGTEHGQQAPLIVPYYLSGKGYGVFLNSTFPNKFNFGKNGTYEFSIYGNGRMDFFVILGPSFTKIIDRYTQLTGRPRLPLKAFFGLALSDKGNDHASKDPSDENWWKKKITQHRNAGFPLDHIVNDNRWRAGGGQRCESYFDWDATRYPHPDEYARWIKANGLITTLDLNRCIAARSDGWKPSFNIPDATGIDFNTSAPDLTKKEVREWFWNLMWKKSLDPKLGYPGDALWIDEFDEMGKASPRMRFDDGSTWLERRNYWFFLIAKSLVQQGWDKNFKGEKRPFVWVRGMTAGAQRYATLWSGDIKCSYDDMRTQVRAMQLAGLSGFPFWGHDAGGFYDYELQRGPTDSMYRQWSMAFGSFTPFWKPHGVGASRWPLDRPAEVQADAQVYTNLRYKLIPYIYTYAHVANTTGLPVARAMMIGYQNDPLAWKHDLQYMWGNELLVAPNCSDTKNSVEVWLPKGRWYDFWNDEKIDGNKVINYPAPVGKLPLFVRQGSIIPMANFAVSTAFISKDSLTLQVYTGADGTFILYEDDGTSEAYRYKNEKRITAITFTQSSMAVQISAATGDYKDAPAFRTYRIDLHGLSKPICFTVNGIKANSVWDADKKILSVFINRMSVKKNILVKQAKCL